MLSDFLFCFRDEMYACLPALMTSLKSLLDSRLDLKLAENELVGLQEQKGYLEEAHNDLSHTVYTLQQRSQS